MEQHSIPRNVTGFQFQLIGTMTLRQFGYLAASLILAFVFFKAPLSFLRLPLAALFVFLGFALAFLPVQERPLDVWILNFLKSVYSPTEYFWQKQNEPPFFLTLGLAKEEIRQKQAPKEQHKEAKEKLTNYLKSIAPAEHQVLDEKEKDALSKLSPLLAQKAPTTAIPKLPIIKTSESKVKPPVLVSGIIKNKNKTLPGVIVSIKDEEGIPVRLLKSDSGGRFSCGLPLKSGLYEVEVEDPEKEYVFERFGFRVNGQAFHPWLITPIKTSP